MRQLIQNLGNGETRLLAVPAAGPGRGRLLVRTNCSLVSAGTERMLVDFGKAGWIGKARQQPEKVRAVLAKLRANGIVETVRAVRAKLAQPIPLGYCNVGTVVAVGAEDTGAGSRAQGAFGIGHRVVSNAPHAEVVSVAQALGAKIPDGVTDAAATFTPLAAIAWQGISLLAACSGDKVVVTGLGLIGQLAVRILCAQGCDVLGFDPDPERRARAQRCGAAVAEGDPVTAALAWTAGRGVAGVLITASTASNAVISQAARSCRYRGKVVLVGVVGLQLNRADFYRNEVSFQVSKSYGRREVGFPDSVHMNFEHVLALMADGKLPVEDLITHRFPFENAPAAYEALADRKALGIVMNYGEGGGGATLASIIGTHAPSAVDGAGAAADPRLARTMDLPQSAAGGPLRIALIGAGNFANRTLLPALRALPASPVIAAVISSQGVPAMLTAQAFGAMRASTDDAVALSDKSVSAVFITTRHDSHAQQALAALDAGKHVWVEKPLALTLDELREMESRVVNPPSAVLRPPILMVGFNRRFAPMAVALRDALRIHGGRYRISVTVNAGRLDPDHWTLDPKAGGGRIVGEGCHFVDLLRFLAGSPIAAVRCTRRDTDGQDGGCFELRFEDGSSGVIDYRTDLPPEMPKERIEVIGEGCSAVVHNWAQLTSTGLAGLRMGKPWGQSPRKGHPEALAAFFDALPTGIAPISYREILEVSKWAIEMQQMSG